MHDSKGENLLLRRQYIRYFIPAVIAMLIIPLPAFVDMWVLSRAVGDDALAALGLVMPIFYLLDFLAGVASIGGGVRFSQAAGAGDTVLAGRIFTRCITTVALLTIPAMVAAFCFTEPVIMLLGGKGDVLPLAVTYLGIMTWDIPFYALLFGAFYFLTNDNAQVLGVIGIGVTNAVNIVLDLYFVLVLGWGVEGAAWATVIAQVTGCSIYGLHFLKKKRLIRFDFRKPDTKIANDIIKLGMPQGLGFVLNCVRIWVINLILVHIGGNTALTVGSIVINLLIFMEYLSEGLAEPIIPIDGALYGEGNKRSTIRVLRVALLVCLCLLLPISVLVIWQPGIYLALFQLQGAEVIALAPVGVMLVITSLFFMAANAIFTNYFVAIDRPKLALLISFLRNFLLITPGAWLLSTCMGSNGVWCAFIVAEAAVFLWLYFCFVPVNNMMHDKPLNTRWLRGGKMTPDECRRLADEFERYAVDNAVPGEVREMARNDVFSPLETALEAAGKPIPASVTLLARGYNRFSLILRYEGSHDLLDQPTCPRVADDTCFGLQRRVLKW